MEASSDPGEIIPGSIRGVRTPYLGLCRTCLTMQPLYVSEAGNVETGLWALGGKSKARDTGRGDLQTNSPTRQRPLGTDT